MSSETITRNDLKNILNGVLPLFYPVGSYYETSDTTFNPNVSWGGTWVVVPQKSVLLATISPINLPASSWTKVREITLEANTRYLIMATAGTGSASSMTTNCDINLESGTTISWYKGVTNSVTASSGCNVTAWAYTRTNTQCVVSVRKYNYTSSAISTGYGTIVAIPLNAIIDESKVRWHRIA